MSYSMLLLQLIPFIVWFIVMGAGVALYVMGSLGTYTVAKHRGLKHAWLAWIPIGNSYIYGALSDDVTALRGIIKKYCSRVLLPVLDGCAAVGFVLVFAVIVCAAFAAAAIGEPAVSTVPFILIPFMALCIFLVDGVMIASRVFASIALYPIYREYCLPGTSLAFAVCGGIFGLHGIFLFAIRNKTPLVACRVTYTGIGMF